MSLRGARKFSVTGSWVSKLATSPIFMFLTGTGQMYDSFPSATSYKDTERYFRDTDPPAYKREVESLLLCRSKCTKNKSPRTQQVARAHPISHVARTSYSARGHPDFPGRRFLPFLGLNQRQGGYSIIFYTV
jgi:hypothetical protein